MKKEHKTKIASPQYLENQIAKIFHGSPKKKYDGGTIARKLKANRDAVEAALQKLLQKGIISQPKKDMYWLSRTPAETPVPSSQPSAKLKDKLSSSKLPKEGEAVGIVDMTRTGAAYVMVKGMDKDIFIPPRHIANALHRDTVKVQYFMSRRGSPEGKIIDVQQRHTETFVGVLQVQRQRARVLADVNNMSLSISVPLAKIGEGQDGDRVVVRVTKWHDGDKLKAPMGEITAVLGSEQNNDIEMRAILIKHGFDIEFPAEVMRENDAISEEIPQEEFERRRDMRDITTFTIDPETAKDFDDAISIRRLDNGNYEIGVHIADVAHYVLPGTALDREAFRRSTSVYLVDRVAPMLPEKLSNGMCSLRPNEDKLTFSAVFEFDPDGKMLDNKWFGRTAIHSNRRFSYEEAQQVIETGEGDYSVELLLLNKFAHKMRKQRFKEGGISFESPEVVFKLDENGKPIGLHTKIRKDAHLLIEDFMLLANREVAGFIYKAGREGNPAVPYVYRIHDLPDNDKLAELGQFAAGYGYKLDLSSPRQVSRSLNKMVEQAQGKPELEVLQNLSIRCMAKAAYSTDNVGHYGLGFNHYTHFTSPIRRYSDVLAHRILALNLGKTQYRVDKNWLEDQCRHISAQERKAMEAERESVKLKQVEYLQDHIGEEFDGVIAGIADHGIFVQMLDTNCEGRINFDLMPEHYQVEKLRIVGSRSGQIFRMGDPIRVKVVRADLAKRTIDLAPVIK